MNVRGIHETPFGYRVYARVEGILYSKRFPKDARLTDMKEWRENTRVFARAGALARRAAQTPATGFRADADRYLAAVKAMPSYQDREHHIEEWADVFGDRPRASITAAEIQTQLHAWRHAGLSASSVNHRRTALGHLYRVLDGPAGTNPVRAVPRFSEPAPEPRSLPPAIVRAILKAMPHTVTRARLAVIAATGLPHASLRRLRAEDVDLKGQTMLLPARRKGAGTRPQRVPITPQAVVAFRDLARFDGWGPFDQSSMYKSFRRACRKVEKARKVSLAGVNVYSLRHSFGSQVYAATGDIRATQVLLGHSTPTLTARYALGAVDARLQAAIRALSGGRKVATRSRHTKTRQ